MSRAMNVSEKFESQSLEKEASKTRHEVELPLPLQDDALFLARRESNFFPRLQL